MIKHKKEIEKFISRIVPRTIERMYRGIHDTLTRLSKGSIDYDTALEDIYWDISDAFYEIMGGLNVILDLERSGKITEDEALEYIGRAVMRALEHSTIKWYIMGK